MRRLAIAVVVPLALALLLAACDDGGGPPPQSVPTRTPPADPAGRFQELEELRKAASFHIIYDRDMGDSPYKLEFAWLQDGERVRWVRSNTLEDALAGMSSIDDGAGSGLTCIWVTEKDWETAEVSCRPIARGYDMATLDLELNGPSGELALVLEEEVEFVGFRTVLDREVECFEATSGILSKDSRTICYTAEGLPLEIESLVRRGGGTPLLLTAKEIRPPPSDEEVLTPIIPDAPLGQAAARREIPLDDLVLPSMPIIEDFFSEAQG